MKWGRIFLVARKIVFYLALSIIVVLNMAKLIFPALPEIVDINISLALICAALITIHAQLDKAYTKKSSDINSSNRFFDGLNSIILKKKVIKTLDVFAWTSRTYCACIRDADVIIQKVRLLIYKPKGTPPNNDILSLWNDMYKNGKIQSLEIKFYEFEPTYHFALIDNKEYHFGFYFVQERSPGYSLLTSFSTKNNSDINGLFVDDFEKLYNNFYDNYSYRIDEIENRN